MRRHPRHGPWGDCYLLISSPRWSVSAACPPPQPIPRFFPSPIAPWWEGHRLMPLRQAFKNSCQELEKPEAERCVLWQLVKENYMSGNGVDDTVTQGRTCRGERLVGGLSGAGGSTRKVTSSLLSLARMRTPTQALGPNSTGQNWRLTSMRIDNPFMLMSA